MKKRVIIVHGWGGNSEEGWFPWLKAELEEQDFEVIIPQLPDPDNPRIGKWVPALAKAVGKPDEATYFVGHSMGCQTIARYLESLEIEVKVGGAVFVAGFFKRLTGLDDDPEDREIVRHWLTAPIDLGMVRSHLPQSAAIFSDDDPWVPLDNQDAFRDELGSKIIIEHKMGHFEEERDGITELPVVLETVMEMVGK